jgi:NhaA family Na+:H+ antiporter
LLIGLELEREIYLGELSNIKDALLPFCGIGWNDSSCRTVFALIMELYKAGAGIPMATDIAFALGILSLLGSRVPLFWKIFLTALAVDDLGAIMVIAIFYTKTILWTNLFSALGVMLVLFIMNRMKVRNLIPYLIGGVIMWWFMLHSGIHATVTGYY